MKQNKKFFTVRKKLIAAIASLAVALIMVVSSTYAWFTLSTAPEIQGITTQIGSNGNLEVALAPESGLGADVNSGIVNATDPATATNTYWGNLIDLSSADYGLGMIKLSPAFLNANKNTTKINSYDQGKLLASVAYNNNGQPTGVGSADRIVTGTINGTKTAFETAATGVDYGVRAIGISTGKNAQEIAYDNAKAAIALSASNARTLAINATRNYGSTLAGIAARHAMNDDNISAEDVAAIKNYATELEKAVLELKNVVIQSAYVVAAKNAATEANYNTAKAAIDAKTDITDTDFQTATGLTDTQLGLIANDLNSLTIVKSISDGATTWGALSTTIDRLIDTTNLTVNGKKLSEGKDAIASAIISNGFRIVVNTKSGATSAGVLADIADFVGTYAADVIVSIPEGAITGITEPTSVSATLTAEANASPIHGTTVATTVNAVARPASGLPAGEKAKVDKYLGFALDFMFRTNAAESKLLLQTDEAQRIYGDSTNTATQGHGSFISFTVPTGMTEANVKALMTNLRIAFVGNDGMIYAIAATSQDVSTGYEVTGTTIKAYLSLYNFTIEENGTITLGAQKTNAEIVSLSQNVATLVTTVVYLDAVGVTNSMVAWDDTIQLKGSINLQFASNATLQPAESDLH